MNTVQRIAKNTGVLFISQIVNYILGFIFVMYTARYLGAEGFGIFSFALAFTGIFGVFSNLGIDTLTVREVARNKTLAGKYLGNIAVMKMILATITYGLITLTINLLGYPEQTIKVVYLVALSIVFTAFSSIFYSIFQAYEKMEYQSLGQILSSALMLSGALFAINQGFSVVGFALIYFLVSAIVLGYSFAIYVRKFATPKIEVDWIFWKSTIKEALPFSLSAVFVMIYHKIDIVMLSIMKGDIVVGWYNAAYKLVDILMFIPVIFTTSIFPTASKFFLSSEESLKLLYEKSFKYLFILSLPIAVIGTTLAKQIILTIYGIEFVRSIIALQILIWVIPFIFLTYMFGTILASINKQRLAMKIVGICVVVNILMNLLLIPKFSYSGAAIATIISELVSFAFCFYYLSKLVCKIQIFKVIIKPVLGIIIMGLIIVFFYRINLFSLVFFLILIYLGVVGVTGTFEKNEFDLFWKIIGRLKEKR